MKKYLIIFYLLYFSTNYAQQGYDNHWLLGYGNNNTMDMNFKVDSINMQLDSRTLFCVGGNASISDSIGNLLFYTNGFTICNKNNDTMGGGHLLIQNEFVNAYKGSGLPFHYALSIIPNPKKAGQYYLFHQLIDEDINMHYYYRTYKLLYSLIDVNANLGNGFVIQKAIPVYEDTLALCSMAAVKHANGKDWWLTVSNWRGNEVFMFLVNENGISPPIIQNLGIPTPFYVPLNQTYDDDSGVTFFSQDGTKLVRGAYNQGFQIYDFDRCTGLLSNPIRIPCPANEIWGAALSRNGRFLYQSALDKVYQYDMWATDIAASKTLIANYDGYATPPGSAFQTNFCVATLAPNGKIYINSSNSVKCLHVINNPDSLGLACNFVQHGLTLPVYNGTIPTPPNYYLGATANPCYGVDKEEGIRQEVKVYPNPAQDKIYIEMPISTQAATFLLYDISGKEVLKQNIVGSKESVLVGKLAKGMYFYEVIFNTKKEYGKLVIE